MSLVIEVTRRRQAKLIREDRRQRMHSYLERWMEEYGTLPPEKPILHDKCPHDVYKGGEGDNCSGCRIAGTPKSAAGWWKEFGAEVPFLVRPAGVSPIPEEYKMRKPESAGGYVNRGLGVRANRGWGPKNNSRTGTESTVNERPFRIGIPEATLPTPVRMTRSWTYPDDPAFWSFVENFKGPAFPAIHCELTDRPSPTITSELGKELRSLIVTSADYQRWRKKNPRWNGVSAHAKECRARVSGGEVSQGGYGYLDYQWAGVQPTKGEFQNFRNKYRHHIDWRDGIRCPRTTPTPTGKNAGRREPWCSCETCQGWFPNRKRSDDWRRDRAMRDLETHLHMFERDPKVRGDRLYRPLQIHRRVWQLFHIAPTMGNCAYRAGV